MNPIRWNNKKEAEIKREGGEGGNGENTQVILRVGIMGLE
jgi:hypothetical protein